MPAFKLSPTLLAAISLIFLWGLESWLPAALGRQQRLRHAARNLTMGAINVALGAFLAAPLLAQAALWAETRRFGLLRLFDLPPRLSLAAAIVSFDAWMYLWHRANHEARWLWRFHRVHHSDPEMDVTTAVRFHAGEIVISSALRLAVIPLLGVTLQQMLIYEMLLLPVILFHHSNVHFPARWDAALRWLIVTPSLHRVHHSRWQKETDSNYASVFSWWDRIAGTFQLRKDARPVNFGLDEFAGAQWQRIAGMLATPFAAGGDEQAKEVKVDATTNPR